MKGNSEIKTNTHEVNYLIFVQNSFKLTLSSLVHF